MHLKVFPLYFYISVQDHTTEKVSSAAPDVARENEVTRYETDPLNPFVIAILSHTRLSR